jgi:hypothetical protein
MWAFSSEQGHATHNAFIEAAENELPAILSLFNTPERLLQRRGFESQRSPADGCSPK